MRGEGSGLKAARRGVVAAWMLSILTFTKERGRRETSVGFEDVELRTISRCGVGSKKRAESTKNEGKECGDLPEVLPARGGGGTREGGGRQARA